MAVHSPVVLRLPGRVIAHAGGMDAAELVRAARRHAGLSQRALAAAAGVGASTLAAVEAGRRVPSGAVLAALVEAAGLELTVDRPVVPLCRHVRHHLRLSLSARLHLLLGGSGRPWVPPTPAAWPELDRLAARGQVHLTGASAIGLWLPCCATGQLRVGVEQGAEDMPARPRPSSAPGVRMVPGRELLISAGCVPAHCTVTVPLPTRSLLTAPPAALALLPECAPWRAALRSVARALDAHAALDRARRRSPAHREPRREQEAARLLFARRWTMSYGPPDRLDGRGWRLDDEVGFQEWIERRAERPR